MLSLNDLWFDKNQNNLRMVTAVTVDIKSRYQQLFKQENYEVYA